MTSRNFWWTTRVGAAVSILLLLTACSKETPVLAIGSGGSLGNYYSVARAIARVVNQQAETNGFRLEHQQTTGSIENIDEVVSGKVAFGIVQADAEHEAVKGLGSWQATGPQTELRSVFSLYTETITVVAAPDAQIFRTRDLIGQRIDIGHPDSGGRRNAVDVLDALGTDWRADTTVLGEAPSDRSALYLRGEIDAFFTTVGHPSPDIHFAVRSVPGARFVGIDNIADLLEQHPYYSAEVIPISLYTGVRNDEDVETVGVKTLFVTSAQVPDEVVYTLTRAVFEGLESLSEFDPVLDGLTKQEMAEGSTAPLHPGAARYYEEVGLKPAT